MSADRWSYSSVLVLLLLARGHLLNGTRVGVTNFSPKTCQEKNLLFIGFYLYVSYIFCQEKNEKWVYKIVMPRKSKLQLPPIDLGQESLGERIARLRKERGWSQAELADKIGLTPGLVSDYERDRVRPHPEMTARFALALEVSADTLLGLKATNHSDSSPNRKLMKRLKKLEALPASQQKFILRVIDSLLQQAEGNHADDGEG